MYNILNPENILLFASYIYFSHPENFFMNDMQNTPEKLYNALELDHIKHKFIVFPIRRSSALIEFLSSKSFAVRVCTSS